MGGQEQPFPRMELESQGFPSWSADLCGQVLERSIYMLGAEAPSLQGRPIQLSSAGPGFEGQGGGMDWRPTPSLRGPYFHILRSG